MTRSEAIGAIKCAWFQRDQDFCASDEEYAESRAELKESLLALGCTEEETGS